MSHNCPECSALCHCNGDIDDACMDLPEDQANCDHCEESEIDPDFDPESNDPFESEDD